MQWLMLQQDNPKIMLSPLENNTVRDFINYAAKELDMEITWKGKGLNEVGIYKSKK